jgi:PncC family amidohydrolase
MTSLLKYIWPSTIEEDDFSVSVAESVTAGALSNILCAEPGASQFFKGGIVTYSILSKKEMLGIDIDFAEKNNFANPFTTLEMAKAVVKKFKSRIGLSTTGYSLPIKQEQTPTQCALDVENPYVYICLYDDKTSDHIIKSINYTYDNNINARVNKAKVQMNCAFRARDLYVEYVKSKKGT